MLKCIDAAVEIQHFLLWAWTIVQLRSAQTEDNDICTVQIQNVMTIGIVKNVIITQKVSIRRT